MPGRTIGLISTRTAGTVDLRGTGSVELEKADLIGTEVSAFVKGTLQGLCNPQIEMSANLRADDLANATARLLPGILTGVKGGLSVDATVSLAAGKPRVKGDLRVKSLALEGFAPGDARIKFEVTPERVKLDRFELPMGKGVVAGSAELDLEESALPLTADLSLHARMIERAMNRFDLYPARLLGTRPPPLAPRPPPLPASLRRLP